MVHKIYSCSLDELEHRENSLQFEKFDSNIAWDLGVFARNSAQSKYPGKPLVIDITLTGGHTLFRTALSRGTKADNDEWIRRKQNTVFRFGHSSFYIGQKLRLKNKTIEEGLYVSSKDYAAHGGSVPLRLKSFDGIIGALTISGLAQEEDHLLCLEILESFLSESK
ncbi:uncharacterized protein LODBEIA_P59170 [Lodderomyces beijingensis]|uniref:Uncharacterized protein n=1 Tax=Lodderomyces beijingensis TaxID=1775926 RepID=A0ABP0ZU83_9ASCO